MTGNALLGMFAEYDFFNNFSEQHLMKLAAGAKTFRLATGEYLAREGAPGSGLYLLQSGQISLHMQAPNKGTVHVQDVGPGNLVGWSWLVPPHKWQFDCRAVDDVKGLGFDGGWLRELCEQDHVLGYQLLKQMITVMHTRAAATRTHLLDMYK
ncbi:MAG: cyclic nucleotide-binding domain-containing protein [Gemmataceae bacterium]